MYALVQNGEVTRVGIAPNFCPNGCSVSNPELLPSATLATFGYLPYTEDIPEYDAETQMPVFDSYEILQNAVVGHYSTTAIPPTVESRLESAENVIMDIMMLMM